MLKPILFLLAALTTLSSTSHAQSAPILLKDVSGYIEITRKNRAYQAVEGSALRSGDILKTGNNSTTKLVAPDCVVTVPAASMIIIDPSTICTEGFAIAQLSAEEAGSIGTTQAIPALLPVVALLGGGGALAAGGGSGSDDDRPSSP